MFCHGALCMAVSGKCYLSLHETGASANRGACRQICRRGYVVTDRETGDELAIENKYIMSPMYIMQDMVDREGVADDFFIDSAATSTEEIGNPVYPPMKAVLENKGIPIGDHRARQLRKVIMKNMI